MSKTYRYDGSPMSEKNTVKSNVSNFRRLNVNRPTRSNKKTTGK